MGNLPSHFKEPQIRALMTGGICPSMFLPLPFLLSATPTQFHTVNLMTQTHFQWLPTFKQDFGITTAIITANLVSISRATKAPIALTQMTTTSEPLNQVGLMFS